MSIPVRLQKILIIAVQLLMFFLFGCEQPTNKNSTGQVACILGTLGCPCDAHGECHATFGEPLQCAQGWCVPRVCTLGAEGCACFANQTCSPGEDGTPLRCEGGVCEIALAPVEGTLGGVCSVSERCDADAEFELVCVQGRCELAGCPSGEVNCGCGLFGMCAEGSRCLDGICVRSSCVVGAPGCPCGAMSECAAGYACSAGLCRRTMLMLKIAPDTARACDVLLFDEHEWITTWAADASTQVAMVARAGRIGLAIIRTDDTPLAVESIALTSTTKPYIIRPDVRVLEATCYGADGDVLELTEVSIHDD